MKNRVWLPQAIATVALLWALNPANPYGYYLLLRVVCFAAFGYLGLAAFARSKAGWGWTLAGVAVLYNPFIRVHLTRDVWSVLNVLTAVIAVASVWGLGGSRTHPHPDVSPKP